MGMASDSPGILIAQHMSAGFNKSFAERLNKCCDIAVKETEDGEPVLTGHAYIAAGGHQLLLQKSGANKLIVLSDAPPVNRQRPSVEMLFKSGAKVAGPNVVGVMLTGIGKDGAWAMREMRDAGVWNVLQDEASCVVCGISREAIAAGAANEVVSLKDSAARLLSQLGRHRPRLSRV